MTIIHVKLVFDISTDPIFKAEFHIKQTIEVYNLQSN